jgi:hypothetical protein
MSTLLDDARKVSDMRKRKETFTHEETELIMAWAKSEIGMAQACNVLGLTKDGKANSMQFYLFAARCLRQHITNNT